MAGMPSSPPSPEGAEDNRPNPIKTTRSVSMPTSMLRPVCIGELQTCTCKDVVRLLLFPEEAFPRCFACVMPVRDVTKVCGCEHKWLWLVWRFHEEAVDDLSSTALGVAPIAENCCVTPAASGTAVLTAGVGEQPFTPCCVCSTMLDQAFAIHICYECRRAHCVGCGAWLDDGSRKCINC